MSFKKWMESKSPEELFGQISSQSAEMFDSPRDNSEQPVIQFNFELLSELLEMKNVGLYEGKKTFHNEVRWGNQPGALKVFAHPDMHTAIRRLGVDLNGNQRWISKRLFQIKKSGYGGFEDVVANELYEVLKQIHQEQLEVADKDFDNMEGLVRFVTNKARRVSPPLLMFRELRRLSDDNYIAAFELTGGGVEAPGHNKVEQLELEYGYDRDNGIIRVIVRLVESKVGRSRKWSLSPSDLDVIFFPSQSFDEMAEVVAVHMKYAYQIVTEPKN